MTSFVQREDLMLLCTTSVCMYYIFNAFVCWWAPRPPVLPVNIIVVIIVAAIIVVFDFVRWDPSLKPELTHSEWPAGRRAAGILSFCSLSTVISRALSCFFLGVGDLILVVAWQVLYLWTVSPYPRHWALRMDSWVRYPDWALEPLCTLVPSWWREDSNGACFPRLWRAPFSRCLISAEHVTECQTF